MPCPACGRQEAGHGARARPRRCAVDAPLTCGDTGVSGLSEGQAPGVDVAGVTRVHIADPEGPGAARGLGGGVDGVGGEDVVGGVAAAAVLQAVGAAVRGDEVDDEVAAVGVLDVDVDLQGGRGVAGQAGDADREVAVAPSLMVTFAVLVNVVPVPGWSRRR